VCLLVAAGVAACDEDGGVLYPVDPPANLSYVLDPSGDPETPAGLLLRWDPIDAPDLLAYRIYSRPTTSGPYDLRGETTSTTFHDVGVPDLDYAVAGVSTSGAEGPLAEIRVDERLRLEAPTTIVTTSLNGAIYVAWSDNPFLSEPDGFKQYRVYSASYLFDDNLCDVDWVLEGTTVAPEFIAGALVNGAPRCFGVSAESIEGWESLWSPIRADTPRPDARNVLLWADAAAATEAGFRFFQDTDGDGRVDANELGLIGSSSSPAMDFYLHRDAATQELYFVPRRTGTGVILYGVDPVGDLTYIDFAPNVTYSTAAILVAPGYGYVFEMDGGDGYFRYGAIRPTHVGSDFVILDWSYQTDPGNPELQIRGGLPTSGEQGVVVRR
jgi:hypothetical protein